MHVNLNATVGHDTPIDDYVSINPLASISGDCVIESDVLIGVGGIVLNGLRVGQGATVGGAACAVRDVAAGTTVVGVPARPLEGRADRHDRAEPARRAWARCSRVRGSSPRCTPRATASSPS